MRRMRARAEDYDLKNKSRENTINNKRARKKNERDKLTDGTAKKPMKVEVVVNTSMLKRVKSLNDALLCED